MHVFPAFLPAKQSQHSPMRSIEVSRQERAGSACFRARPAQIFSRSSTQFERCVDPGGFQHAHWKTSARTQVRKPLGIAAAPWRAPAGVAGTSPGATTARATASHCPRWQRSRTGGRRPWTARRTGRVVGALIRSYRVRRLFCPALATQLMTEVRPAGTAWGRAWMAPQRAPSIMAAPTTTTWPGWKAIWKPATVRDPHQRRKRLAVAHRIRDALSDAFGHGVNAPVCVVALAPARRSSPIMQACTAPTMPFRWICAAP